MIDFRAISGSAGGIVVNSKEVAFAAIGGQITFGAFAVMSGTNGMNDEQVQQVHGSIASGIGGLLGNFAGDRSDPFKASGSQQGSVQDMDGDTDLDIGSSGSAVAGKFVARSGIPTSGTTIINANTSEVQVGQFTFTYTGGSGTTSFNFIPRTTNSGAPIFSGAVWFEDGSAKGPTTASYSAGAPVNVVIPEPSAAAIAGLGLLSALRRNRVSTEGP
jgi:hypothetical protein